MIKKIIPAFLFSAILSTMATAQPNKQRSGTTPSQNKTKQPPKHENFVIEDDSTIRFQNHINTGTTNTTTMPGAKTTPAANRTSQTVKKPGQTNIWGKDSLDDGKIRNSGKVGTGNTPVKRTGNRNN